MEYYEKKKLEALTELKLCVSLDTEPANTILKLFPELEESDYVIKRRLLKLLTYFRSRGVSHATCDRIQNWLEKQGETFTKKDVDDAYLKGVCDAKHELEKQGESKPNNNVG